MSAPLDDSDFIDHDLTSPTAVRGATATLAAPVAMSTPPLSFNRPPTREELETRLTDKQQQLADLKARQDALERERVSLEEARRRQAEFETGRPEMVHQLLRGIELLEQAEFHARREAEQMGKTLAGLREALQNVQGIHQETWNTDNWQTELTRALTTVENARMEWNAARLKWPVLNGETPGVEGAAAGGPFSIAALPGRSFKELCRVGLALTWPLAAVSLLGLLTLALILLFQR